MQGDESIYLVHRSMFYLAARRRQLIASVDVDAESLKAYKQAKETSPILFLTSQQAIDLSNIPDGSFEAVITSSSG